MAKWWITGNLAPGKTKNPISGTLSLSHIRSTGVAWSVLEGKMWLSTIATLIAVIVILTLMTKNREKGNRWFMIGLSLILAGAIGNFIGCTRPGYAADMFQTDLMSFPVFNVVDVTLVYGVIRMLIHTILDEKD